MTRDGFEMVMGAVAGRPCAPVDDARWRAIERTHEDWQSMRSLMGRGLSLEAFCRFLLTGHGVNCLERRLAVQAPAQVSA